MLDDRAQIFNMQRIEREPNNLAVCNRRGNYTIPFRIATFHLGRKFGNLFFSFQLRDAIQSI